MFKKLMCSALLAAASAAACASNYYVVVPLDGKAQLLENIQVTLNAGALLNGEVNAPYSHDFRAMLQVAGDPSYDADKVTWALTGSLPTGLSFNAGVLSGTPTVAVANQSLQVSASYRTKSSTQNYGLTVVDPKPTGYWKFNVAYDTASADSPGWGTITSGGYSTTCSDGTVATGSATTPWYESSRLVNSWENWTGGTVKVCIPANAADIKTLVARATTYTYANGSWLLAQGYGAGVTAGGKKWVIVSSTSKDTAGVYPSRVSRRFMAIQVPTFGTTIPVDVLTKGMTFTSFNYNYSVTP